MGVRVQGRWLLAAVLALVGTVAAAVVGLVVIGHSGCGSGTQLTYRGRYVLLDPSSIGSRAYSSKLAITPDARCG